MSLRGMRGEPGGGTSGMGGGASDCENEGAALTSMCTLEVVVDISGGCDGGTLGNGIPPSGVMVGLASRFCNCVAYVSQ